MVQQVAGKLEVARLGKRPLQFSGLSRSDVLDLRFPLLPVLLVFRVLVVLRALLRLERRLLLRPGRLDDELMDLLPLIANSEDVSLADLERGGLRPDVVLALAAS